MAPDLKIDLFFFCVRARAAASLACMGLPVRSRFSMNTVKFYSCNGCVLRLCISDFFFLRFIAARDFECIRFAIWAFFSWCCFSPLFSYSGATSWRLYSSEWLSNKVLWTKVAPPTLVFFTRVGVTSSSA